MTPEFRAWYTPFKDSNFGQTMKYGRAGTILNFAEMSPDKYVVEQYTGLKDINGNKIFEGDIVQVDNYETVAVTYGTQDHEEEFGDHFIYQGWNIDMGGGYPEAVMNDLKVIGNIHDNPELLEAGQ